MTDSERLLGKLLRRDRLIFYLALATVLVVCWVWLILGAGMSMSAIDMTRMAGMDGWLMQQAQWTLGYAALMFSMWWIMMIAMMLPSAAPVLLLYMRLVANSAHRDRQLSPVASFAAGYLLAWGLFSALATALQWAMEASRTMSPMLEVTHVWLAAAILIGAGLWQLTPLKAVCLRHCRSPLGFLMGSFRAGPGGALRMGIEHGAYCLGCCWFLMGLLFSAVS